MIFEIIAMGIRPTQLLRLIQLRQGATIGTGIELAWNFNPARCFDSIILRFRESSHIVFSIDFGPILLGFRYFDPIQSDAKLSSYFCLIP
jgi:hypothetical protein